MAIISLGKRLGAVPSVLLGDSFISEKYQVAYVCVPKVMSRSVIRYLADIDPDTGYELRERNLGKSALATDPTTGIAPVSFTFVRNPYSRAVSFYQHMIANYLPRYHFHVIRQGLSPDMTFREFVDWLGSDKGTDRTADPHFLSQTYFVFDEDGEPAVDHVGRFEDAELDVPAMQRLLGLPVMPLPRLNVNAARQSSRPDATLPWRDLLDDRSIRILNRRYDADFEVFGYERLTSKMIPLYSPYARTYDPKPRPPQPGVAPRNRLRSLPNQVLQLVGLQIRRVPRRNAGRRLRASSKSP